MNINKKLATQIVDTVKDICDHDINFIDCNGIIYASTDNSRIGSFHEAGKKAIECKKIIEVNDTDSFCGSHPGVNLPIYYQDSIIAVIGISGKPDTVRKYAYLAKQITNLLIREKELNRYNQNQVEQMQYIINSIVNQNNLNSQYFMNTITKFKLDLTKNYRFFLIKTNKTADDQIIFQTFKLLSIPVYSYQYPNQYLVIIETNSFNQNEHYLKELASSAIKIIIGKEAKLLQLSDSYNSILISLNNTNYDYIKSDDLTLEMILLSINDINKQEYLYKTLSNLSNEDIRLLKIYFEEEQSLANTCKRLFIHKNTLQYKLDRIHRLCGYNPRKFTDANILFLAIKLL